jgi:H+/Cl- antiporter ClcA
MRCSASACKTVLTAAAADGRPTSFEAPLASVLLPVELLLFE